MRASAGPTTCPGDDTDRYLEYWNHVFMTYDLAADGSLSELPMKNIDTGMGLERMAAILQDVESVFDTDALRPLVDLAEELSGRSYDQDSSTTRAMRILADHSRGRRGDDRRRRRALERGARLCAAADHAARDPPWPLARPGGAVHGAVRRPRPRPAGPRLPGAGRRARHRAPLGCGRGGELRPHARPRHGDGPGPDPPRARGPNLVGRRGGRLQAPRHLRLPVRPDQGAAGRTGTLGRRRGLRGADGGAADACADGDRERARLGGPPRRRAQLRLGGTALALRRLREAARRDQPARRPGRRRARPGQARGEPLLRGGRRPGR